MALQFLNNPLIKNFALKAVKEAFTENKLSMITITLDDQGELKFDLYDTPVNVVKTETLAELLTHFETLKIENNGQ